MATDSTPYITAKGRDLRLDLLRGYFVFAMVVDHVCGASPLWLLTGGNRFFAGAAEGFILMSGLVTGLVYGRRIKRDGLAPSLMKVLSRALTLYLLTLGLTLAFLPLSEWLGLPWAQGVDLTNPSALVVSILTLHRTYHLVDVLLLYTLLFLVTPLVLLLIDQGKRWWVLGGSWLLWALFQLWPEYAAFPWPIAGNYLFNLSAWQVVFFTGLVVTYGRATLPVPRPEVARRLLLLSGAGLLLLLGLYVAIQPAGTAAADENGLRLLVEDLFLNKVSERPGRLVAAGVTFSFLFLLVTVFWRQLHRALGWLLLPLGQHSLYAYTAHVALVALVAVMQTSLRGSNPGPWGNALIQIGSVALLWVLVRYQFLAPTPRTRRLYRSAPVLLAVAVLVIFSFSSVPAEVEATQSVSRFGTPLPRDKAASPQRVSRFGTPLPPEPTPVPEGEGQELQRVDMPLPTPTPRPAPTVEVRPNRPEAALERVAEWVGEIEGILQEYWFYSPALDREMPYWAYLPPGYDTSDQRYPVLYLLHGAGGHRDEWLAYGLAPLAGHEMAQGTLPSMIIILPQGDQGFWVNNVGGPQWGDYVLQDLIPEIDSHFRTLAEPEGRAIGGLSMGGFGALTLAFTHPETFAVVGAHTPSLHVESSDVNFLGSGDQYAQRDPMALAATLPGLDRLRLWIDVGAEDHWLERAQELHDILSDRGIDHEWHVLPGSHLGEYWMTHLTDYLRFYGEALAS